MYINDMKAIGIFEAKTKFSEICEKVNKSKEPILITKRGVPFVKLDPIIESKKKKSEIWELREKFIKNNGSIEDEFQIPERKIDDSDIFKE